MPVTKTCEQCGSQYSKPPSIAKKSRFCSKACHNENQTTAERRELKCEQCDRPFIAARDHGNWPRFCSRDCFKAGAAKPDWKTCPSCDGKFLAERSNKSDDGLRIYCSKKCAHEGARRGLTKQCVCCGKQFFLSPIRLAKRPEESCCSKECKAEFYRKSRSPAWKGGSYINSNSREKFVFLERDGYVGKHVGEHRVVAGKVIGRLLKRGEVVIRINRNPSDNRPENLFLCESNSDFSKRRSGSLPWPTASNLAEIAKAYNADWARQCPSRKS